jgi:lipid A 3-O-deacylase
MGKKNWLAVGGVVVCIQLVVCAGAWAKDGGFGVSGGYGQSTDNIDIFRLGIQKPFSARWFESRTGALSGYFELSYNLWDKSGDTTHGAAFSPVVAYYFNLNTRRNIIPYIEAGIGAAYIDDYRIAGRNLSSNFQFEDRIGIGVLIHRLDIKFGYMHYSNAGLKSPNDGIDILLGTLAWRF